MPDYQAMYHRLISVHTCITDELRSILKRLEEEEHRIVKMYHDEDAPQISLLEKDSWDE